VSGTDEKRVLRIHDPVWLAKAAEAWQPIRQRRLEHEARERAEREAAEQEGAA
jgi:hypothetical protein